VFYEDIFQDQDMLCAYRRTTKYHARTQRKHNYMLTYTWYLY